MDGHRKCNCGSYAELIGSMHTKTCFVRCPNCGASGQNRQSPFRAWLAWDNGELEQNENYSLYELMEGEND